MIKFILPGVFILALLVSFIFLLNPKQNSNICKRETGVSEVSIRDDKFIPENIEIKRCTKVVFKNLSQKPAWPASDLHPTHGIYPEFDPLKGIEPGKKWSFVFDKVGTWKYHNHLSSYIRGVITVTE